MKTALIRQFGEIAQVGMASALKPVLDNQAFTLQEAGKAHQRLASGQAIGKVVVTI